MAQDAAAAADAAVDAVVAANESGDKGDTTTTATEQKNAEKAEEQQLEELTELLYQGFDIKDRKWRLNTYPKCFVASEAITWMVENKISTTREEAVELGRLLVAANIMHHVLNEHDFGDDKLFFRFLRDEPSHGAKEKKPGTNDEWSWSDYIPGQFKKLLNFGDVNGGDSKENDGGSNNKNNNLQAKLEPASQDVNGLSLEDHDEKFYPEKTFGVYPLDKYNQILLDNVHPIKWVNPKAQRRYNMVAIGAGAAGLITAAASAALGGKVAIIEENLFGGDCLNSGCVPSKALLKSAKVIHNAINRGKEFGLKIDGNISVDFGRVMERMREIRSKISYHDACERFTKQYGMDVFLGRGVFISENQVKIGDQILEFARCVVATGGRASVPPIDGLKDVKFLTNHSIWNLTSLPKKLGVIGSGPIGCEMAQAFSLFGSEVIVMNRSARILGKEDIEAASIVEKSMQECGIKFYTGLKFLKVYYNDSKIGLASGIKVDFERTSGDKKGEKETLMFDYLLIAAGRTPNVDNMGLEKAKIKYDIHSGIEVNNYLQTTNGNIYAAGDCCTRYQFTHMADSMARIVVRNALFFGRAKVSDLIIPWCTYTLPEIGHVGLYERDLKERNILYDVFKVELSHNDRQICEGDDNYDGFVKVLCKKGSDTMLGATIVSENAGDQISEITVALQGNLGLAFLAGVIHPYPTVSEGIKQTGEAYRRTMLTPVRKALLRKILQARRG